jgi:hypothetical protein
VRIAAVDAAGNAGYDDSDSTFTITAGFPYFEVEVSPTSQTVNPGGTATYTIIVKSFNGFNRQVSFIGYTQNGISLTFNPATVTPPANGVAQSQLTVATSSNLAAGKYGISIECRDVGGQVFWASAELVVIAQRGKPTVSITPAKQYARAGTPLSYTISITNNDPPSYGASTFSITYSVPEGWWSTISKTEVTLNPGETDSSIKLSVASPTNAAVGDYTILVTVINLQAPDYTCSASAIYGVRHISARIMSANSDKFVYQVGETITVTVDVFNDGDEDADFLVAVSGVHESCKQGNWIFDFGSQWQTIPKNTHANYIFTYDIPPTAIPGTYALNVIVWDKNGLIAQRWENFNFMIDNGASYMEVVKAGFGAKSVHFHISKEDMDKAVSLGLSTKSWKDIFLFADMLSFIVGKVGGEPEKAPEWLKQFNFFLQLFKWSDKASRLPSYFGSADYVVVQAIGNSGWLYDTTFVKLNREGAKFPVNIIPTYVNFGDLPDTAFYYLFGGSQRPLNIEKITPLGSKVQPGQNVILKIKVTNPSTGLPMSNCKATAIIVNDVDPETSTEIDLTEESNGVYSGTYSVPQNAILGVYNIKYLVSKSEVYSYYGSSEDQFEITTQNIIASVNAEITFSLERNETIFYASAETYSPKINVTAHAERGKVVLTVRSETSEGGVLLVKVDNETLPISTVEDIKVIFNGKEITKTTDYADALDYQSKTEPKYFVLNGTTYIQVLIAIPHFSEYTIEIIPEFPITPALILIMLTTLITTTLWKTKRKRQYP